MTVPTELGTLGTLPNEGAHNVQWHLIVVATVSSVLLMVARAVGDDLVLGDYVLTREVASEPLRESRPVARGLRSFTFLNGVGGVAFGGVASSADGSQILSIRYSRSEGGVDLPDGSRVRVTMIAPGGATAIVSLPLYDWQLVPIARLAASEQEACFTLFGQTADDGDAEERRTRGERILSYHPAVANTLLGLRLFQADVLALDLSFCDLPRLTTGYLLGAGERAPDVAANETALSGFYDALEIAVGDESHQSYLICDHQQPVTFALTGDRLVLTGEPYWWCWRYSVEGDAEIERIWEEMTAEANRVANSRVSDEFNAEQSRLGRAAFNAKWTETYQQARFEELFDEEFDRQASKSLLREMPQYSERYTEGMRLNKGGNPVVYDALVVTMRHLAFLRRFKQTSPDKFAEFLKTLEAIPVEPQLLTPTIMRPRV